MQATRSSSSHRGFTCGARCCVFARPASQMRMACSLTASARKLTPDRTSGSATDCGATRSGKSRFSGNSPRCSHTNCVAGYDRIAHLLDPVQHAASRCDPCQAQSVSDRQSVASGRAALAAASELKRGRIDHALRVTVRKTRRAYVAPATHCASRDDDVNLPRIGERIRLRKEFDVSGFSPEARTVLNALKKHGMFVADNGIEWAISVVPDE